MKYVLIFILGFIGHKAVNYVYDYSFNKGFTSSDCTEQYIKDSNDPKIDAPLTKRFQCTEKQMGMVENLKYLLLRPNVLSYKKDWTF